MARDSDFALSLHVDGLDKLLRKLNGLEPKVRRMALRRGMRAGAKIIRNEVVRRAPKRTGDLRRNVKVRAGKRSRKGWTIEIRLSKEGNYRGKTFYGAFGEFGTKVRRRKNGQITGRVRALHFMESAFDARAPQARDVTLAMLWADIKMIAEAGR